MPSVLDKGLDQGWIKTVENVVHPKEISSNHSNEVGI